MRRKLVPAVTACWICASVVGSAADPTATNSAGFVRVTPEQVPWQDVPGGYGAQIATLAGDPSKPGLYLQRVKFPPHVMTRPHWHPGDRYITVLQGTWYTGTGPTFDPQRAIPLKPGSYMLHPGKAPHWDGSNTNEEVIVQVFGMGPLETVPAEPGKPLWARTQPR